MLDTHEKQYHIGVTSAEVGKYCIIPGDPGRCEKIASFLDNPYHVGMNREYNIWNGYLEGELVTVCSTGIGGPSTAIAVEELVACGAETIIRIGTCGGISLDVKSGDVVIASGAVRQDGTSAEYAPAIFPAVADASVLFAIAKAAKALGYDNHIGVVQAKDSFYGQHRPAKMPTAPQLLAQWDAWKKLGVKASEMESGTLFVVSSLLRARSGGVFSVVWNQERYDAGLDTDDVHNVDTEAAIRAAIEAIKLLIEQDK
jgi:uridine phosphorylase